MVYTALAYWLSSKLLPLADTFLLKTEK